MNIQLSDDYVVYDIETYPNIFTMHAVHLGSLNEYAFEISEWQNDTNELLIFLTTLNQRNTWMIGFNNYGFDYPVLHYFKFITHSGDPSNLARLLYKKAKSIIESGNRFHNIIWSKNQYIQQLDLYKIHHFDNNARATSLKMLEFNMRSNSIEDLPFPPGTYLNSDQRHVLKSYNRKDVIETLKFYVHTIPDIAFRKKLTAKYDHDFMNHNDTKIGKDYLVMQLEERAPGTCYYRSGGRREMRQTHRAAINLNDIILPIVRFEQPEFNRVLNYFRNQTITETKGVFKDLTAVIDGFEFVFGTGGIHGSVESESVHKTDDFIIEDLDVTSYYPSLAIVNRLYPAHLGELFCDVYKDVFEERRKYPKGTPENAALKLALNGVYGDSNNQYSPFYDPQFTMSITINGQLLLCMLAEQLIKVPDLELIQINTDGLTIRYHKQYKPHIDKVAKWWQQVTGLQLESAMYKSMFIRDVNNYLAVYENDDVKRKGAYEYELEWHKNHSALIVPKAAEAALVHGVNPEHFVKSHTDPFDFYLRTKVPRDSHLEHGGVKVPNIVRYYISTDGAELVKVMPPKGEEGTYKRKNGISDLVWHQVLDEIPRGKWDERIHTKNKSRYEIRRTSINAGHFVTIHNVVAPLVNIDYNWYINEIDKLIKVI